MGTKNNPGHFDCYAKAEPDEPMFVLLARDPLAPDTVEAWARRRERDGGDPVKIMEARECARAMRDWHQKRQMRVCQIPACGCTGEVHQ